MSDQNDSYISPMPPGEWDSTLWDQSNVVRVRPLIGGALKRQLLRLDVTCSP